MNPADILTYLNKIVGLHRDINPQGLSRYTLTDQRDGLPLKVLDGIKDCNNPVNTILENARSDASRNFMTDFSAVFSEVYDPILPDFSGNLGKIDSSLAIADAKAKAVIQLWSWGADAVMSIRAVQLFSTVTATVTVGIYSENDLSTPINSFSVNCIGGRWVRKELDAPVLLDLSGMDFNSTDDRPRYFIAWTIPAGSYPRTNKFVCCGQDRSFMPFVELAGYSVDALSELTTLTTAKSHGSVGMGMSLEASAACSFNNAFTRLDYSFYNAAGWQWVLAKTLQHGGVVNLADSFIKSQNFNQYTLLSRESVYGTRSHAEAEYRKGIKWLVQNMPAGAVTSFKCRDTVYRVGEILV